MGDYASYKEPITVKGLPGDIQYNDGADDLAACHTANIRCNPDGTSVLSATIFVGDGGLLSNIQGGGGSLGPGAYGELYQHGNTITLTNSYSTGAWPDANVVVDPLLFDGTIITPYQPLSGEVGFNVANVGVYQAVISLSANVSHQATVYNKIYIAMLYYILNTPVLQLQQY